jgi:predicted nucleic acid-binding protein
MRASSYIEIDEEVVDGAVNEPDRVLRSLDAIHLATARLLGSDLDALVTYDNRLASAATEAGLAVLAPAD